MAHLTEVIFIGLPGPTHHYGGLSADNVASSRNRGALSSPKTAALQALALARALMQRGVTVGFFAPQLRPHIPLLAARFPDISGADALIAAAAKEDPALLEKASASSAMWAANAATVSPSPDNRDGVLHITTANLLTNLHRRIEAADTSLQLQAIFEEVPGCVVHPPLPENQPDEGAANHMRLGKNGAALNVFVYSDHGRQSLAASQAIAQNHAIKHAMFVKQNPDAIAHGVFHNDVIAVSHENLMLVHERAFSNAQDIAHIAETYEKIFGEKLIVITISNAEFSIDEAVSTYLFNSQIVTKQDGKMLLIAPEEVQHLYDGKAAKLLEKIRTDPESPIDEILTLDLRQSMHNGGGPACLRLRVPMTTSQVEALRKTRNVIADEVLLAGIETIVSTHYRDELSAQNLADPALYHSCETLREEMLALMKI